MNGDPETEYQAWCLAHRLDPESVDSMLAYEEAFADLAAKDNDETEQP